MCRKVDFPEPEGPDNADYLALIDGDINALQYLYCSVSFLNVCC
jgi:hypothetical protein